MNPRSLASAVCGALIAVPTILAAAPTVGAQNGIHERFEVGDTLFHVQAPKPARTGGTSPWGQWLAASARPVAAISGRFPVEEVFVRLETGSRSDVIGFGRIERRSTPTITFTVRPDATVNELLDDWRGYHEMAHLLIPFPGNRDIWFTEGLASYYQYFLMARAGRLSAEAAWREFVGGLLRGMNHRAGHGQSLRRLAPRMWRQSAFKRVYWTGAAYFLRVDTRLRAESGGRLSVDRALAAFQECCRRNAIGGQWNAEQLIERLGKAGRADIWREEYERMIDAPAAPDFGSALERVGIGISPEGHLRFETRPEAIRMREAIAEGHRPAHEGE